MPFTGRLDFTCSLVADVTKDFEEKYLEVATWEKALYSDNDAIAALVQSRVGRRRAADYDEAKDVVNYRQLVAHLISFKDEYNALETGIELDVEKGFRPDQKPTCVRYVWVDGRLEARFNYGLTATGGAFGGENQPTVHFSFVCKRLMHMDRSKSQPLGNGTA